MRATKSPTFITTISTLFHAHQPREHLENFGTKRKSCLCSSRLLSSPVLTSNMVPSSPRDIKRRDREYGERA